MKSCPHCRSEQSWTLGDGRLKCRSCGARYSWRSVWDGVRLPEMTRHDLLEAFVQGVTAYRQRFDAGACVDSRERFYRLARACCALDTSTDGSAVRVTNCAASSSDARPRLRGWNTATRVVVQRRRRASLAMTPVEVFWEYAGKRLQTFRQIPCRFLHLGPETSGGRSSFSGWRRHLSWRRNLTPLISFRSAAAVKVERSFSQRCSRSAEIRSTDTGGTPDGMRLRV